MPNLTRKSLREASKRTKIVDDPDHPGQPKDVSPLALVRSREEVAKLLKQAEVNKSRSLDDDVEYLIAYCQAVQDVVAWLTDATAQRPWLIELGEEVVNES